jgi:hypothetical protein
VRLISVLNKQSIALACRDTNSGTPSSFVQPFDLNVLAEVSPACDGIGAGT